MERIEKRVSFRIYGQTNDVDDHNLLVETRVMRHMEELENLGRNAVSTWILGALKNQYILDQNFDTTQVQKISPPAPKKPAPKVKSTTLLKAEEPAVIKKSDWTRDDSASKFRMS